MTLTLRSGAVVTIASPEIVAVSSGASAAIDAVLVLRSATNSYAIYELDGVDLECRFRRLAEGLVRRS